MVAGAQLKILLTSLYLVHGRINNSRSCRRTRERRRRERKRRYTKPKSNVELYLQTPFLDMSYVYTSHISASVTKVQQEWSRTGRENLQKRRPGHVLNSSRSSSTDDAKDQRRYCYRGFRETLKPFAVHVKAGKISLRVLRARESVDSAL